VGLKIQNGYFPVAGSTTRFIGGYNRQCTYAHDVESLSGSLWVGVVYECCARGITGTSGTMNTVMNCYAESCSEYGAYWSSSSGVLFLNNYSHSASDSFVAGGTTAAYGYDTLGSTVINRNAVQTRSLRFYDRAGNLGDHLKASANGSTSNTGKLALHDSNGVYLGELLAVNAYKNGDIAARREANLLLFGVAVRGKVPPGWTVTHTGLGRWDVDFGENIRWPFVQVTPAPTSAKATVVGQKDVIACVQVKDAPGSGNWLKYQNATGIQVQLYEIDSRGQKIMGDFAAWIQIKY